MALIVPPIAAGWLGQNVPQFDVSRQMLLEQPLQPPQIGQRLPQSSTLSAYRLRPNAIHRWDDFPALVTQYHGQIPQADKLAGIGFMLNVIDTYNHVRAQVVSSESRVKAVIDAMPIRFHEMLTTSNNGQPLPSDVHSMIQRYEPAMRMAGWPDYIFWSADETRSTVMMDGKNPWKVTPASIDQVLDGTAAPAGDHAGRLAVEQVYGYMYHNQVQLGLISTVFGWVFLRRQDLGQLYMTPMFGCHPELGQDFHIPQGFTIMQALYYFSHLAEELPLLQETTGARPGFIYVERASTTTAARAPEIEIREERQFIPYDPGQQYLQPLQQQQYVLTSGIEAFELIFESWNRSKSLGEKTWLCKLLFPRNEDIVIKIWDSFKSDASARDREVAVYMKLQMLWGKVIPTFIASCPISIFHGLILEYMDGSRLTAHNWRTAIEQKLRDALDAIHGLGIIHGDVRLENIIVGEDGNVWFIDFETALLADSIVSHETREEMIQWDRDALTGCFRSVRPREG